MVDLIKVAEEAFATQQERPTFKAGDTITVAYKIVEGNKERIQLYRGVVIKIKGHGDKKRFTVRKIMRGKIKSIHGPVKLVNPRNTSCGFAVGKMTRRYAPSGDAPSIYAASAMSFGIVSK